ncbi:MAG: erythromycin esterase family protein [Sphingobacteriales bacterium]|nr:erythromycin esterase family protein [Sphingobacteriales bacterium]
MRISLIHEKGDSHELTSLIRENSVELNNSGDLDLLLDAIGDARYVLLGEASHGTHEYYTWRSVISRRLIEEKGFSFIAVEGDWPDCYRVNRYIKGYPDAGPHARDVVTTFNRWPTWMWANWEIVALSEWMRKHNTALPAGQRAGFYGLDVYSLWESLEAIIHYLDKTDKKAKETALEAWRCFEPYSDKEGQAYARASMDPWVPASCETEVVDLLTEIRKKMTLYNTDPEAVLNVELNALTVVHAEQYYRAMVKGGPQSWNIRDQHMVDTLRKLMDFHGPGTKAIVWEHNTHIGDARATDMRFDGMINVGQLLNEMYPEEGVFATGFGSYTGAVIAGRYWNDVMRKMTVPPARVNSWEYLLHQAGQKDRLLIMNENMKKILGEKEIGHRAIGVVYNPQREAGNYVPSILPLRYDAFIFIDETRALLPLHIEPDGKQMPETYPFGM